MASAQVGRRMPRSEFEALERSVRDACRLMSREQIIDLADSLFDIAREQREETRWDAVDLQSRI